MNPVLAREAACIHTKIHHLKEALLFGLELHRNHLQICKYSMFPGCVNAFQY